MPCHSAIAKKHITALPDESVEKVLANIKKNKVNACAIIDESSHFLGLFSMKILLKNLIPVSVVVADGVEIDVKVTAAPGVAKRLENAKTLAVSELMDRSPNTVMPDTSIWEGVSLLTKHGSPLVVVDNNSKFHGLITYESLVIDLENMTTTDS